MPDSELPTTADRTLAQRVLDELVTLDRGDAEYATRFVEALLRGGLQMRVSDIHLQPTPDGLSVQWRVDGVLQTLGCFARGNVADPITRLKVLADLLTYRNDIPQEGRLRDFAQDCEMRVSVFPTLHGERAVVRLFASDDQHLRLHQLGFPADTLTRFRELLAETSGALLITGPAGSGKTTTAYASLREIVTQASGSRCVVTLEDPIEVAVPGVAQSQANEAAGFTLSAGLRSLLRQDPEVILVGEVRDRETAEIAFQAALTGQLVISTFHAGSAAEAISRLSDMGIEPYLLRSGIRGILGQRLVRRLCQCAEREDAAAARLGLVARSAWRAVGCTECLGTGYRGRLPLMELLVPLPGELGRAILSRADAPQLETLAVAGGMQTRWTRAIEAIEAGLTTPAEVRRVLGFGEERHL